MATREPEMPHTQTSAPVKPPQTTDDPAAPRKATPEPPPVGDAGLDGEHMPRGADEPGAGL